MQLRKINAGISLLCTVLLLYHAIFLGVWMLSKGAAAMPLKQAARALMGLMVLHGFISIFQGVSAHSETETNPGRQYPKLNRATMIQRISGILLFVFAALHVAGTVGLMQPPQVVHAILPPLFFTIALLHTAVSSSKALITLGIGSAKAIKVADRVIKVLCVVTLIADITGFYLFVC